MSSLPDISQLTRIFISITVFAFEICSCLVRNIPQKFPSAHRPVQAKFDELEKQVQEMNTNNQALNRNYNQLIELKAVLEKDEVFFHQVEIFLPLYCLVSHC